MGALIIPKYIRDAWDLKCLNRLLSSVANQTLPFERGKTWTFVTAHQRPPV